MSAEPWVVKVENGFVVQEFRDCNSLGAFANKYGISGPNYIQTQHPLAVVGNRYMGGTTFAAAIADTPTPENVNDERDRRIALGRTIQVGSREIPVRGSARDRENMIGLAAMANAVILAGQGGSQMQFRDEANVIHFLTWVEMAQLAGDAMAYVSACYAAAWALKDNPAGIPSDFRDNSHWPEV